MRILNKQKILIVIFVCLIIIIVIGAINHKNVKQRIRDKHLVVCASILKVAINKSGGLLTYEFVFKTKKYEKTVSCLTKTKNKVNQGLSTILVVFDSDNPSNSDVLEDENDFKHYNIKMLDTLGKICN